MECDENTCDPTRIGGRKELVKDFKISCILLGNTINALNDDNDNNKYTQTLFAYTRKRLLETQGGITKEKHIYTYPRAKKMFFSSHGNGMKDELDKFFHDYCRQSPMFLELLKQINNRS